ncbi:TonB-dependent receptor [Rhodanobacter sp. MP7CTX1]|uniref:TonB-dependent receptor n=1 Tax=Rhodanobacter sp. MP7CTX1 TaxID=2723084 RepID=UPI00160FC583|nr:TonB-dependent receptor [Rhodanobacter sp. MP7CTX1]MBB6188548.1 outer membrane receptor protein involved in Fe transport [Rhodanobacter sp. MP7CTX1]
MSTNKNLNRLALSAAIAGILVSGTVMAQDNAQPQGTTTTTPAPATTTPKNTQQAADAKNVQTLQQVVVTGTANGGLKKIDASYSITTATLQQIKEANPKSAADLLKISPGVYPESSGGQTGANIEVAGFPGGGDAPYVSFQLNGSPLYPMSTLSFMDNSSMFRLDDTIERLEAVQGGPSVLYGSGQPGLTANFILKQGTGVPSGDIGLTYGSEGMERLDGFFGFKIADGWFGSIGGFWRKSDGVRDPQFTADDGGSLTATLSHDFDNGTIMFYARDLKDHNQFVTDTPILNPSSGSFSNYPGFSPLTGTFGSKADRYETIQTTPCNTAGCTPGGFPVDLAKGRGADLHMAGGNLDLDFGGGWSLSDKFNFTGGQMNTISFFSTGANPSTLASYISGAETADGLPAGLVATANYTNGGAANMNENVNTQGLWYVHKEISSASNEIHLSKELFDGNTLTAGNYTAVYSDHDTWYLGNSMLLQAQSNPNPIVVNLSNGTNSYALTSPQGFASGSSFALHEAWNAVNTAFFLADSWKVDRWLFDAGVRIEHQEANGTLQNNASGDLDNNPNTLYNNGSSYLINSYTTVPYSKTAPSWTLGANYEFNDNMSAYVRVNDGIHFPGFDDLRGLPSTPVQKIHNMELGFKYQADWIYASVSAYHRLFYGVPYTITTDTGQQSFVYDSDTKGINFQTLIKPFEHFTLALGGDYMDGHYTHYLTCVQYVAQDGSNQCTSINGMQLQRQPKFQARLTPAYDVPTSWGSMRFWITYEYVGNRYGDLIEQQPLGNYYDLSFGAAANIGENWSLTLQGTNLTDQTGITEGNARLFGFASSNGVILARSIEGREVNFQVKYNF